MAASANAQARGAVTAVGLILLAVTPARWVAQAALAAEAPPVASDASSSRKAAWLCIRSASVSPAATAPFHRPGREEAINNDCLICHSAGMVLDQATLSRAEWQNIVDQMRNDFKAPFAAGDTAAIVDYLANLKNVMSQGAGRPPDAKHGALIAAQGTPTGAPPCAQCHAFNGVSDASGAFPRLAGQSAFYLAGQLRDFASEVRVSALMTPIAQKLSLTPDSIADVRLLRQPRRAVPAAQTRRPRARQGGEDLAKAGGPIGCTATIAMAPKVRANRRQSRISADNTPTTSPSPCRCGRKVSAENRPDAMAVIAKIWDEQDLAAVAASTSRWNPLSKRLYHRASSDMTGETHDTVAARPEHVAAPIARGGGCAFMRGKSGLMP